MGSGPGLAAAIGVVVGPAGWPARRSRRSAAWVSDRVGFRPVLLGGARRRRVRADRRAARRGDPAAGRSPCCVLTASNALVGAMVFSLLATEVAVERRSQTLNLVYLPLYAAGIIGPAIGGDAGRRVRDQRAVLRRRGGVPDRGGGGGAAGPSGAGGIGGAGVARSPAAEAPGSPAAEPAKQSSTDCKAPSGCRTRSADPALGAATDGPGESRFCARSLRRMHRPGSTPDCPDARRGTHGDERGPNRPMSRRPCTTRARRPPFRAERRLTFPRCAHAQVRRAGRATAPATVAGQRDHRQQHREPAVPERRQREHRRDRHRPAAVGPGAPDDDRRPRSAAGSRAAPAATPRCRPCPRRVPITTSIHVRHRSGSDRERDGHDRRPSHRARCASDRHSRRTANQSRPIPGVIFVSRTSDQAAGQRNPRTIAAASRSETLPPATSIAANGKSRPAASSRGPVRKRTAASSSAVQTRHERLPRQRRERRDRLEERRRVDVGDRVVPVAVEIRVRELGGLPVAAGVLAGAPEATPRLAERDDQDPGGDRQPVARRAAASRAGRGTGAVPRPPGAGAAKRRSPAESKARRALVTARSSQGSPRARPPQRGRRRTTTTAASARNGRPRRW